MFILSPSGVSAFLHSQDPLRHFATGNYCIAKGSFEILGASRRFA
jgi:hypothetical protein